MKTEGRSADQIVANDVLDHSSWHFFQAMSWLDLAKRTQKPAALHYAAFDLRYGVEYLLFELLVLTNRGLTEAEYQKCLGDPHSMKKTLRSAQVDYEKLADFSRILLTLEPKAPKLRYWKLDELFKYWGIASELLHFVGAHSRTYASEAWFVKSLARLESVLSPIWETTTMTLGFGLIARHTMEPEVFQAWQEFSAGKLKEEDLKIRMRILQPALEERRERRQRK
jgi:hypothetical protein